MGAPSSGAVHADIKEDFRNPSSVSVGTELVAGSITSAGIPYEQFTAMLPDNPHVKFFESRKRGYLLCDAGRKTMTTDLRVVDNVRDPKSGSGSAGRFVIEAGRPGAVVA